MATILPTGETTFFDQNGVPLAGGTVEFYIPGTTTPKDTWQNSGQSILNSNPVTLDSSGRAIVYGSGAYRQIVKDSIGNLVWDQETSEPNAGSVSFGGTTSGSPNAQTLTAAQFSFLDGQIISFVAGLSNTGATTISIGGGNPIPILKNGVSGPVNLAANDIVAGNSYFIQYSKANNSFQLLLNVAPAVPTGSFLAGYLFGLTLSNNSGDAANSLDLSTGFAASDGASPALMTVSSTFTKKLNSLWSAGTGNGMLDTGAVADGTYHIFCIQRSDTGVVDFLASTNATTPTMPASYDRKRRIGSIIYSSSAIMPFLQIGDDFFLKEQVPAGGIINPGTGALPIGLNVPQGISVTANFTFGVRAANASLDCCVSALVSDISLTDSAPNAPDGVCNFIQQNAFTGALFSSQNFSITTNNSGQIRVRLQRSAGGTSLYFSVSGWCDTRGRIS